MVGVEAPNIEVEPPVVNPENIGLVVGVLVVGALPNNDPRLMVVGIVVETAPPNKEVVVEAGGAPNKGLEVTAVVGVAGFEVVVLAGANPVNENFEVAVLVLTATVVFAADSEDDTAGVSVLTAGAPPKENLAVD